EAERLVFEIAESGSKAGSGFVPLRNELGNIVDRLDMLAQNKGQLTGVSTGFTRLDEMTAGLQKGDLIVIAGRPSMGKTTFALNIAENAAFGPQKCKVGVFSMEMSREQLAFRMVSSLGHVDQSRLRIGNLDGEDWSRVNSAIGMMKESSIFIDDTGALTPTEVRARARRLKREHGLDLIVLDYLQLMQVAGNTENRATEISEISRSLKALAKELGVPLIALSQLNRGVEQRTDKKPVMSDLRESGAIEQDADVIMMIYREEVYDKNTTRKGIADIIITKQRNGEIGEVQLTFLGKYTKFENFAPESSFGDGPFR
ncbi:MAG TPA: replicative DNA helicase, partial [Povalibacter sp.]|nr:replicative DNA helicase [Povalibacter sp.]